MDHIARLDLDQVKKKETEKKVFDISFDRDPKPDDTLWKSM